MKLILADFLQSRISTQQIHIIVIRSSIAQVPSDVHENTIERARTGNLCQVLWNAQLEKLNDFAAKWQKKNK